MDSGRNRRARTLLAALALVAVFSSQALAGSPRAVVEESSFTAEPVREGLAVAHEFTVANAGDEPLLIRKVKPS